MKQSAPQWLISPTPVAYPDALNHMEKRVEGIIAGVQPELIWLLQHPPLYTAGTSAEAGELKDAARFPVYQTGRGGRYTYHGPGQRVIYAVVDLRERGKDIRAHVWRLEEWVIRVLADFGVTAERREGRIGLWVGTNNVVSLVNPPPAKTEDLRLKSVNPSFCTLPHKGEGSPDHLSMKNEEKIAAIGVRVRKWVAYHGLALNVSPDLSHFSGIVPCGISEFGVTSLEKLGVDVKMDEVDAAFQRHMDILMGDSK